jgi:hypothetical protein
MPPTFSPRRIAPLEANPVLASSVALFHVITNDKLQPNKKAALPTGRPCEFRETSSLRWHYPDQVLGVDSVSAALSAWLPKLPPGDHISTWGKSIRVPALLSSYVISGRHKRFKARDSLTAVAFLELLAAAARAP